MKQLGGFQVLRPLQGPGLQTLNIEIITCTSWHKFQCDTAYKTSMCGRSLFSFTVSQG